MNQILKNLINEKKDFEKSIYSLKNKISKGFDESKKQKQISETLENEVKESSKRLTEIITEIKTLNQLIGSANLSKDTILNLIKIKTVTKMQFMLL